MFNLSSRELVDFLALKSISANQLLFCWLIHSQQFDLLYKYIHEAKPFKREELTDLADRGYIINQDHHSSTEHPDMFVVTERLLDGLELVDTLQAEELWLAYPNYIYINGQPIPGKSTDKGEFLLRYARELVTSRRLHERVLKAVRYARDNNLITMGIVKWVTSQQWEAVEERMQQNDDSTYGREQF